MKLVRPAVETSPASADCSSLISFYNRRKGNRRVVCLCEAGVIGLHTFEEERAIERST